MYASLNITSCCNAAVSWPLSSVDMQERGCFLDGYSLLEMMVLCRAARGLTFLVQEIFKISKVFTEANSFFASYAMQPLSWIS